MMITGQEAPELQRQLLDPSHPGDALAGCRRPGERDLAYPRVADQQVAQLGTGPGEYGEHAVGQAGVDEAGGQCQRGQWCGARGLEDNSIACRQCRGELVQHQQAPGS